jgi:hypothetical protein
MQTIPSLLSEIEALFSRLPTCGYGGTPIAASLRSFWKRGTTAGEAHLGDPFVTVGFEWNTAAYLIRDMPMHRGLVGDQSEAAARRLHERSYLLTADSPP